MNDRSEASSKQVIRAPLLEWIFGGIGLVLTLSMIGFIGWQAMTQREEAPLHIELRVEQVSEVGGTYAAEIVANNHSRRTAKGVEVEGTLRSGSSEPEVSSVTFDYIPGCSSVRGGLRFSSDPTAGDLQLRALGHARP